MNEAETRAEHIARVFAGFQKSLYLTDTTP
jgi:hypothetical protein